MTPFSARFLTFVLLTALVGSVGAQSPVAPVTSPKVPGVLRFEKQAAEVRLQSISESGEGTFPFENTGTQPVIIKRAESSCPACATVRVEPEIVEPGGKGHLVIQVPPSTRGGEMQVVALLVTVEADAEHAYEVRLTVQRPACLANETRAAARLAKRESIGLTTGIATGNWELQAIDVWMDAREGESVAVDMRALKEAVSGDFPVGQTRLELKADGSFTLEAGRHRNAGRWSVTGNCLPLKLIRPDCPACDKTWALEGVKATADRLVVDLPDEDEGSPQMIRLDFKRQ